MKFKVPAILAAVILTAALISAFAVSATDSGYRTDIFSGENTFPYEDHGDERTFTVFIGGAVEREGYYTVPVGISYLELFTLSGFEDIFSYDIGARADPDVTVLISGFCYNVNYAGYEDLLEVTTGEIARLIADFVAAAGGIEDKEQLMDVLTREQFDAVKDKIYALLQ
jgi:hypothetical protein